jgi:gentisate 1,2-dioxygenase
MKRSLAMFVFLAVILSAVAASAQNPNYNVGPVWRVIYIHIHPGQADAFWGDVRQHLKPIYDEMKKQNLITDYKVYVNPVVEHPNDWSVAVALLYTNWATLDQLAGKAETITAQHYGSRQAMMQAAKARAEIADVIGNHLAREVTLK